MTLFQSEFYYLDEIWYFSYPWLVFAYKVPLSIVFNSHKGTNFVMALFLSRNVICTTPFLLKIMLNIVFQGLNDLDEDGLSRRRSKTSRSSFLTVFYSVRVWLLSAKLFPINPKFITCNNIIQSQLSCSKKTKFSWRIRTKSWRCFGLK